jgi:NADPH-dependent curcumin reductase CurA
LAAACPKGVDVYIENVGGTAALEQMTDWVKTGRIRYPEVIVDGLESAPAAFAGIFRSNSNVGKLLVRVSTV